MASPTHGEEGSSLFLDLGVFFLRIRFSQDFWTWNGVSCEKNYTEEYPRYSSTTVGSELEQLLYFWIFTYFPKSRCYYMGRGIFQSCVLFHFLLLPLKIIPNPFWFQDLLKYLHVLVLFCCWAHWKIRQCLLFKKIVSQVLYPKEIRIKFCLGEEY